MKWLNQIAYYQNIRNEEPNKALAALLADEENAEGISEVATGLYDKNKSVSSDCLAVLYNIGYSKPVLIEAFMDDFLQLLESKINRMVWGSMIALSTLAPLHPEKLYQHIDRILHTLKTGSLITEVWGIKLLVSLSLARPEYKQHLFPLLIDYLEQCRPIDFATRTETLMPLIQTPDELGLVKQIISSKQTELSPAQVKKLNKVLQNHPDLAL